MASLGYRASSRTAKATWRNLVLKKQKKKIAKCINLIHRYTETGVGELRT